ncbi:MAG TPA: 50S ribosomal protein L33 [Chondromyces sp.]|nr:50S ribosomal protein L33 [Chondromyces sp.]
MNKKVTLACSACGSRNYSTSGKGNGTERLEIKKFCKLCNEHTIHKQTK